MSLNSWSKRWLLTTLGLLIIIVLNILALSMMLLQDRNSGESNLSLNQVRLKVNPILLALEQNHQHLNEQNIREVIRSTARETGVLLTYLNFDGETPFCPPTPPLKGRKLICVQLSIMICIMPRRPRTVTICLILRFP